MNLLSPFQLGFAIGAVYGALACAFALWALDRFEEWKAERKRVRVMVDRIVAEARAEQGFGLLVPGYFEERAEREALH